MRLLSQCGSTYNCLSRSVLETPKHVAETLTNQTTVQQAILRRTIKRGEALREGGEGRALREGGEGRALWAVAALQ